MRPNGKSKVAARYSRVSTKDQKDNGTSLETQSEAELVMGLDLGLIMPEEYHIQEDWTGTDLNRPGLLKLYSLAESGLINVVLIYSQDRLYRPEKESDRREANWVTRSLWVASSLATTRSPDVPRSRRCTIPGRRTPPIPERSLTWRRSAFTSVPDRVPAPG